MTTQREREVREAAERAAREEFVAWMGGPPSGEEAYGRACYLRGHAARDERVAELEALLRECRDAFTMRRSPRLQERIDAALAPAAPEGEEGR